METALLTYLGRSPWSAGMSRTLAAVKLRDWLPLTTEDHECLGLLLLDVSRRDFASELYLLPITFEQLEVGPGILTVQRSDLGKTSILCDATGHVALWQRLLDMIRMARRIQGQSGYAEAWHARGIVNRIESITTKLPSVDVHRGEQTNTSATIGGHFHAKLYRRLTAGENPELEIGRYLTETAAVKCVPAIVGAIHYHDRVGGQYLLAIVHDAVAKQGDGWSWTLSALHEFLQHIPPDLPAPLPSDERVPAKVLAHFADHVALIERLGQRTAELHVALAASHVPAFVPEPFDRLYQQVLYDAMYDQAHSALTSLQQHRDALSKECQSSADIVLAVPDFANRLFHSLLDAPIVAQRIRCHGDYHLGQVLFTGTDFVIIDFEGEPDRPVHERRMKGSPLRDVAGMLRSFHYASRAALINIQNENVESPQGNDNDFQERWLDAWCRMMSTRYVRAYLNAAVDGGFLPRDPVQLRTLLRLYTIDKALYELRYELNHRPTWVGIPLDALRRMVAWVTTSTDVSQSGGIFGL